MENKETVILEQNIKNIFIENMNEFANKEAKGDRTLEAKIIGYLTNFIVLSDFSDDLAVMILSGELKNNELVSGI